MQTGLNAMFGIFQRAFMCRQISLTCVVLMLAASVLLSSGAVQPAHAEEQTKLFCSHAAPGVEYVQTFQKTGNSESKIVDAKVVLNAVIKQVSNVALWRNTFTEIVHNQAFFGAVSGAILLYVVIFGILIVFNLVNLSWYEVFMRLAKIAIVYYLLVGTGMTDIVAKFIMGGMNELIESYYTATIGSIQLTLEESPQDTLTVAPLMFLLSPMEKVMNLQFICAVFALMIAGPAGFGLAMFLFYGLFNFFMAVIGAIATYIKAMIGLTLLFAIAPIFIICLLFEQTKRLFNGWLTMCLNFALQPVFVFAFLGFFMVMLDGALEPLTKIYWCYGPVYDLTWMQISFYFPVPPEYFQPGAKIKSVQVWINAKEQLVDPVPLVLPLNMQYGIKVKDLWKAAGVDLYVVDVMMFCLLSTLCWRYSEYTGEIAKEIVGGGVSITTSGQQISTQLSQAGLDPKGLAGRATQGAKGVGDEVSKMFSNFTGGTSSDKVKETMTKVNENMNKRK